MADRLHHRISDDATMVESQLDCSRIENVDFGGVGGGLHLAAEHAGQEGDADVVATRVAVGVGVDADEARDLYGEARLLSGLAHGGLVHRLPRFDESSR